MQQIADWLKMLGMSEYAQRFAENRIDFSPPMPILGDPSRQRTTPLLRADRCPSAPRARVKTYRESAVKLFNEQ
jgi:hypothetical protein